MKWAYNTMSKYLRSYVVYGALCTNHNVVGSCKTSGDIPIGASMQCGLPWSATVAYEWVELPGHNSALSVYNAAIL